MASSPPDTTNAQAFLPEPKTLKGGLLLADRGYVDLRYLRRVDTHGGSRIIRAKAGMNAHVLDAYREDGKRLRSLCHKPLQVIHAQLPTRQRFEGMVRGQFDRGPLRLRLLISWHPKTKRFGSFLTTLPPKRFASEGICRAYKWRWPVALLVKEWKSSAEQRHQDRGAIVGIFSHASIEDGLVWQDVSGQKY